MLLILTKITFKLRVKSVAFFRFKYKANHVKALVMRLLVRVHGEAAVISSQLLVLGMAWYWFWPLLPVITRGYKDEL